MFAGKKFLYLYTGNQRFLAYSRPRDGANIPAIISLDFYDGPLVVSFPGFSEFAEMQATMPGHHDIPMELSNHIPQLSGLEWREAQTEDGWKSFGINDRYALAIAPFQSPVAPGENEYWFLLYDSLSPEEEKFSLMSATELWQLKGTSQDVLLETMQSLIPEFRNLIETLQSVEAAFWTTDGGGPSDNDEPGFPPDFSLN